MLLETSGEITPEKNEETETKQNKKKNKQTKNNKNKNKTQFCMGLVIEARSDAINSNIA